MLDHSHLIGSLPAPRMLIGDTWVSEGSHGSFELIDPSTGTTVTEVPMGGPDEAGQAVAAAAASAASWRDLRPNKRRDMLLRLAESVAAQRDRFATIAAVEQGTPDGQNYARHCAEWIKYYAGWSEKIHGSVKPSYPMDALTYVLREPYGVAAVITPFNESLVAIGMKVAPALAAGNCIVIKPPEQTPLQTTLFAELCLDAGIPPGVVNVITGGPEAGDALVRHRDVRKVTFTGGIPTARAILKSAAETVTPVVSELGGKSANILFADGDWQAGARLSAMTACVSIAGQGCIFPTRLLVEKSIHGLVIEEVKRALTEVRIGDPARKETQMGPSSTGQRSIESWASWNERPPKANSYSAALAPVASSRTDISSIRRSSTRSIPKANWPRKRCSVPSWRSAPSATRTKPSPWPTALMSGSRRTSTPTTSGAPIALPAN